MHCHHPTQHNTPIIHCHYSHLISSQREQHYVHYQPAIHAGLPRRCAFAARPPSTRLSLLHNPIRQRPLPLSRLTFLLPSFVSVFSSLHSSSWYVHRSSRTLTDCLLFRAAHKDCAGMLLCVCRVVARRRSAAVSPHSCLVCSSVRCCSMRLPPSAIHPYRSLGA